MTTLTIEDLEVTSFFTDEVEAAKPPYHDTYALNCGYTEPVDECICTADISTCSRTSVEGGCDTSVQCVSVPQAGC